MTQPTLEANTTSEAVLCASLELSEATWKVCFTGGAKLVEANLKAGDFEKLFAHEDRARKKLQLPAEARVVYCYEAGRDGFWIQRRLAGEKRSCLVVDSSSIQVSRRAKQAKTDGIDVRSLAMLLLRHVRGDTGVWQVVKVPSVEEEDARRPVRERGRLVKEKTAHTSRIKSLLALFGLKLPSMKELAGLLPLVPLLVRAEIQRECERRDVVVEQLKAIDELLPKGLHAPKVQRLVSLTGIGRVTAACLVNEFFGWREFKNGKQVGGCAGLTPTPFASGSVSREQGISKAGNRRVRALMVEIAWIWLRYQPESGMAKWYAQKYGGDSSRSKRVGIVALARKLLVALWRFADHGVVPDGALLKGEKPPVTPAPATLTAAFQLSTAAVA